MHLSEARKILVSECPGLTARQTNSLIAFGYTTIGQVMDATDSELSELPNFGHSSLKRTRSVILDLTRAAAATGDSTDDELDAFLIESAGNKEFLRWCLRHRKLLEAVKRELP